MKKEQRDERCFLYGEIEYMLWNDLLGGKVILWTNKDWCVILTYN